jgi:replicative DNA helicase
MLPNIQLINNGSDESILLKTICEIKEFQAYILSQIDDSYFGLDAAQEIYRRMILYLENGKNIPTMVVWRGDRSISEAARAIFSNVDGCLTDKEDVDRILEKLRDARNKKLIFDTILNVMQGLEKNKELVSILTTLENLLQRCRNVQSTDEFKHYEAKNQKKLIEEADKQMSEDISKYAVPTCFSEFDRRSGGLFRRNVLVLASVPGGGKSAMAMQMAVQQYIRGYNVCIVTYEMDLPELDNRVYANVSKVNHSEINLKKLDIKKRKLVLDRYGEWLQSSKKGNRLSVWAPQKELTIPQIAMELKSKNYDVIYIDYLGLLYNNPKKQMWENLGEHTRAAKLAANQLDAAMVLLAQLDDETNKIKYAKAIQANANFVWTWEFGDKERESGIIEVNQRKARNAPIYPFYLETDYTIFSFKDYLGPLPDREEEQVSDVIKKRKRKDNSEPPQPEQTEVVTEKKGIPKMPQLF